MEQKQTVVKVEQNKNSYGKSHMGKLSSHKKYKIYNINSNDCSSKSSSQKAKWEVKVCLINVLAEYKNGGYILKKIYT